jgi:4'-phosphopantetheinyl transferase
VKALGKGFSAAPFNTFTIQSKVGTKGEYNLCKVCFDLNLHSGIE